MAEKVGHRDPGAADRRLRQTRPTGVSGWTAPSRHSARNTAVVARIFVRDARSKTVRSVAPPAAPSKTGAAAMEHDGRRAREDAGRDPLVEERLEARGPRHPTRFCFRAR